MEKRQRVKLYRGLKKLRYQNNNYVIMGYSSIIQTDLDYAEKLLNRVSYVRVGNILLIREEFRDLIRYLKANGSSIDNIIRYCVDNNYSFKVLNCKSEGSKFRIFSKSLYLNNFKSNFSVSKYAKNDYFKINYFPGNVKSKEIEILRPDDLRRNLDKILVVDCRDFDFKDYGIDSRYWVWNPIRFKKTKNNKKLQKYLENKNIVGVAFHCMYTSNRGTKGAVEMRFYSNKRVFLLLGGYETFSYLYPDCVSRKYLGFANN